MLAGGFGEFGSAEHSGHFLGALFSSHAADASTCASTGFLFLDDEVMIAKGCDLRQMCHTQHLVRSRQRFKLLSDSLSGAPPDPGINLVEHQSLLGATPLSRFYPQGGR